MKQSFPFQNVNKLSLNKINNNKNKTNSRSMCLTKDKILRMREVRGIHTATKTESR